MVITEPYDFQPTRSRTRWWLLAGGLLLVLMLLAFSTYQLTRPPSNFTATQVDIPFGSSVANIATILESAGVVRSSSLLYVVLLTRHDIESLRAGVFTFEAPQTVFGVADVLTSTIPREPEFVLTFPEGFTHYDFNVFVPESLAVDSPTELEQYEGYLFPDTYFVPASFSTAELVAVMQENFETKIASLDAAIEASGLTRDEVVVLASIIEREANDPVSMRLVSGVLYNRLAIGMALQVDASVAYGLGISGTELTREHLTTDGPFNTYTRTGLPPTPIANPGLEALTAAVEPTPNEYLFYITGNDGNFYYAETLDEHNDNVARYLR